MARKPAKRAPVVTLAEPALVFAAKDITYGVQRFTRTESTEGWYFFSDDGANIGTLIAINEGNHYYYVHGSFTSTPDPATFWEYLLAFLNSIGITSAFVSIHAGGTPIIYNDFDH